MDKSRFNKLQPRLNKIFYNLAKAKGFLRAILCPLKEVWKTQRGIYIINGKKIWTDWLKPLIV